MLLRLVIEGGAHRRLWVSYLTLRSAETFAERMDLA